jgi:hypothetical protein
MIEALQNIIKLIGPGNALAIALFLISIFIAFYLYFRTFYRLVYSTDRICKNCNKVNDWTKDETEFVTRIIFYNNGRKTITRNEIKQLELISSNKIEAIKQIKGNSNIKTRTNKKRNIVNIDIEYLDSSESFVLEINHSGKLEVKGRISETGNLLHTEPKYWLILNVLFIIFFFIMMFYNIVNISDEVKPFTLEFITNLFILFGIFSVIRFIHSILFIPDSLSSKYLDTKDKFAKDFKN